MMNPWMITWLILAIVTLVVELMTVGLTSIWLTGGALAALIANALHAPVWLQVVIFFVVTFGLLYFTRPWAIKYLNSKRTRTNYEETIGREVRVIERVDNHADTGRAVYNGMEWTARALNEDETFEEGTLAIVANVVGVKLILKRKEAPQDVGLITEEQDVVSSGPEPVPVPERGL
ncbi:MAG: NfeD family protein [Lachnospiraceae bacterium]|nr:NfeD family protein [Lachnospiraceae bacterium]